MEEDEGLMMAIVVLYRAVCTPQTLLRQLISRFHLAQSQDHGPGEDSADSDGAVRPDPQHGGPVSLVENCMT